jgi:catechol 2,3-dioxygenase-like lactoylglutathione lyase family enzyme
MMPACLIHSIDHVQIAAPPGCEPEARRFYGGILGFAEIEKPEPLRGRGGCWFQCGDRQLHIGVEKDFQPAGKAHPAFAVKDVNGLRGILRVAGIAIVEDDALPGVDRFYAADPWGNRLEFVHVK